MPNCYIMIGLPASGKDYYIKKYREENEVVVSSDGIREELFGDVNDQKHNGEVFNEMFKRACSALKNGQNVYYNATNINRRRRINLIKEIKNNVKVDICFYAIVIATPYERCLINNDERKRKVPKEVIKRMYYHFEPPMLEEGFSHCILEQLFENVDLNTIKKDAYEVSHDNPHHSLTIGEHMNSAYFHMSQYLLSNKVDDNERKNRVYNFILVDAAKWHDIGKIETKTFRDGIAHYYNHQNVGACLYLCSKEARHNPCYLVIANLIYHHMDFFDDKKIEKDKAFFSEKFMKMLSLLHEMDIKAH